MILVAMLIALTFERLLSTHRGNVIFDVRLIRRLPEVMRRSEALPWGLVIGLALIVGWITFSLQNAVLELVFASVALLLCLGPRDLAADVERLRAARSVGNAAEVARLTRVLQMGPEPDADHRSLLGALFIQSHERRFGMLLWFLAAGPAGAVAYRIASRLPASLDPDNTRQARAVAFLHNLLAWAPTRITGLLYGLAGSLDDALGAWRRVHAEPSPDWQRRSWSLLAETANAALDWEDTADGGPMITSSLDATLAEVLRMETRATLVLLALIALFTAGAWIA